MGNALDTSIQKARDSPGQVDGRQEARVPRQLVLSRRARSSAPNQLRKDVRHGQKLRGAGERVACRDAKNL